MKVELTARAFEIDDKIREYAQEKLGGLEKFVPKDHRASTSCAVVLEEDVSGREDNRFVCDAVMVLPGTTMVAREGTVSMFAAIDIVEAKLQAQLVKHKDKLTSPARRDKLGARMFDDPAHTEEPSEESPQS